MTKYIGVLRGINVGGRNKIKMADLRSMIPTKLNKLDPKATIRNWKTINKLLDMVT